MGIQKIERLEDNDHLQPEEVGVILRGIHSATERLRDIRLDSMPARARFDTVRKIRHLEKVVNHREKRAEQSQLEKSQFESKLDKICANRYVLPSIAIDSEGTIFAEQAHTLTVYGDGSFAPATHILEFREATDPMYETLRAIKHDLAKDPWKQPRSSLPPEMEWMSFMRDRQMPAISFQGVFRPDRGITSENLILSATNPQVYNYSDVTELEDNEHYIDMKKFAYAFAKYRTRARDPEAPIHRTPFKEMEISPAFVTEQFVVFAKAVAGKWMHERGIPALYTTYRGDKHQRSYVRTRASYHEGLNTPFHAPISRPGSLESWVPSILLSGYVDDSAPKPDFDRVDMQRFASWRNKERNIFNPDEQQAV